MRQWSGSWGFCFTFVLILLPGCSDEAATEQKNRTSSFEQIEEMDHLRRLNTDLRWEIERLKLKVPTVSGLEMAFSKKTGLWHHDVHLEPFTGRAVNKFADGSLQHDASFYKGKKDGIERYWHPNGEIRKEQQWMEGQLHGYATEWNPQGYILNRKRYDRGEQVHER